MADQTTAVAGETVTPPVDLSPAVPAAPVTMPDPDTVLARIKAKLHEANPPPEPAKKPEAGDDPEAPKLNVDPKVMKTLGRLQEEVRTASAKVKELEPLKADAEFAREVREAWNKGGDSRLEALAKLGGKDGIDVLAEVVAFFYERDQQAAADADPAKPAATPETKALLDAIGELKKEVAELKSGRTTEEETRTKAAADEDRKNAVAFVERFLSSNKERFEISARKENVAEAVDLVQSGILELALKDGFATRGKDGKIVMRDDVTAAQANDLYMRAAAEVEKEYEETGRRFAKVRTGASLFNPDKYARPLSKPTVTLKKETLSANPAERERQLRERLKAKLEDGGFSRG